LWRCHNFTGRVMLDFEALGRELGVLKPSEEIGD
jgi:hypothetical protein